MSGAALQDAVEAYKPVFTGEVLERLQQILPRYPTRQAALLPALWLVQEARGWISDRDMAEVGAFAEASIRGLRHKRLSSCG